ncbi:GNAT family N-acetyltransferase [Streptomyces sp. NPDC047315]|uniref:GNAT family N-acetyltransferase n=1 Tax=Streptomyces sp. NPDC047315 TaxID=3155142 RepID=UPI0033EA4B46
MNVTMDAATTDDFHRVLADHPRFWGERDMRSLHLLAMVQEFGPTCLVARAGGEVVGYVFGFTTPAGTGYVHLVATRDDARGTGLGRRLYGAFAKAAQAQGATALKAITSPANTGSIAFHRSLGFACTPVPDYDGRGRTMVVFTRALPLAD